MGPCGKFDNFASICYTNGLPNTCSNATQFWSNGIRTSLQIPVLFKAPLLSHGNSNPPVPSMENYLRRVCSLPIPKALQSFVMFRDLWPDVDWIKNCIRLGLREYFVGELTRPLLTVSD
ncbi:hypothetical protein T265_05596 [Opisthorchis viverrini]|uniref:Uncharacterized protein n=1 Tax=Opisthorchis viverrini TaxID=6198 RepID=A0A075AF44_OPIVI|nr:hypothetical protein T265_05596 [Opisthorchis viverrini]KER27349.1 hypothetical protein T265_05596 [Opisthorchis viverrini]